MAEPGNTVLLDRFLDHLTCEKRYSRHTVDAYGRDLAAFHQFLLGFDVAAIEEGTDKLVRAWMMRSMEGGVSPRTVSRRLSALRGFYRFARTTGSITVEPTALIEPPKAPSRLPEFVEEARMDFLFDQLDWPDGFKGSLDRAVMELLYGTGMRLAELIGLRVGDMDLHSRTVRVLGKRNKERILPLGDTLIQQLQAYSAARSAQVGVPANDAALFVGVSGEPLSRRTVQRLVKHYLGGVTTQRKRSPHVLRHTFATHMLEHGADLNAVKELLGHAGLAATQVYTHNTVEKLRKVHAQAHPRGGRRTDRP